MNFASLETWNPQGPSRGRGSDKDRNALMSQCGRKFSSMLDVHYSLQGGTDHIWGPSRYPAGVVLAKPSRSCSFFAVAVFLPEGHNVPIFGHAGHLKVLSRPNNSLQRTLVPRAAELIS